jgi:hypothetical protein
MHTKLLYSATWLLAAASICGGQQPTQPQKSQAKRSTTMATGTFVGRSGKPMAGARIMLGKVLKDQDVLYAQLKIVDGAAAVVDAKGHFQLKGFTPGSYALVYQPAGASNVLPVEISIRALIAETNSPMPLLRNVEIGNGESYPERIWGKQFVLLKGHTFLSLGANMKIWNATVRRIPSGPQLEIRRRIIWMEKLADNSEIKFNAWSY